MAMLTGRASEWIRPLLSASLYKPGMGQKVRQSTVVGIAGLVIWGAYSFAQGKPVGSPDFVIALVVSILGTWVAWRVTHVPRFADFLINTEAEVNKVSWPSWADLKMSTTVVVGLVVLTATFLFVTDTFWKWLLTMIGILKIGGLFGGGGIGM